MSNIDWSKAPEGATHYLKGSPQPWRDLSGNNWLWFWNGEWHGEGEKSIIKNTSAELIRSQGDNLVPRPSVRPIWNGEGLPPVGCLVEDRSSFGGPVYMVEIAAVEGGLICVKRPGMLKIVDLYAIHPIRTAEQIAADEAKSEVEAMADIMRRHAYRTGEGALGYAEALHKAGYRKQVAE